MNSTNKADASSPTPLTQTTASQGKGGISSGTIVAIVVPISVAVLIFIVFICCLSKRRRNKHDSDPEYESAFDISHLVSQQYDFHTIKAATNNFSVDNMIGKGGFAEVYQGMLLDGQKISVKRFY
ncbi:hypothetical protein QN277_005302 [Acacia crassicarpa]|uniref:Mid2 domain-containing protein n=1 Tax=Acacia crassicarpa TaxID=499986 RepID=A0AAE1IW15_9FABA|nr:hypothetical protein QN277_005302 [Acacia crassicarpa]